METARIEAASPFARLPVELVGHILGFAAAASRHSSLDICLVTSWSRRIALPYLFHSVVIGNGESYTQFKKYLYPPSDFHVAPFVHNLWLEGTYHDSRCILPIYESCSNVAHLALTVDLFNWLLHLTTPGMAEISDGVQCSPSHDLQVTFLSSMLGVIGSGPSGDTSPIYKRVTHICLTNTSVVERHIDSFIRLSHISMPCRGMSDRSRTYLQRFLGLKTLKMLVVVILGDVVREKDRKELKGWVREVRQTDSRVFIIERHSLRIRDDWEKEMRGGESIWNRAIRYTTKLEANARWRSGAH